jgi:hypothetical protein
MDEGVALRSYERLLKIPPSYSDHTTRRVHRKKVLDKAVRTAYYVGMESKEMTERMTEMTAAEERWADGRYTTVGLNVYMYCWGWRMVRIRKEGRTRVYVSVRLKNGRVIHKAVRPNELRLPESTANILTKQLTAVGSFSELVNAKGGYRPTLLPRSLGYRLLAVAYDQYQIRRGDNRRAHTGVAK